MTEHHARRFARGVREVIYAELAALGGNMYAGDQRGFALSLSCSSACDMMYGSPLVMTGKSDQSVIAMCTSDAGLPSHFATASAVDIPVPISASVPKSFCVHAKPMS